MEIKRLSNDNLTKKEIFRLTDSAQTNRMADSVGEIITISKWAIYEDINAKNEQHTILTIETPEGIIFSTISETFITRFEKMVDAFGDELEEIIIQDGTTKSGRTYITCDII